MKTNTIEMSVSQLFRRKDDIDLDPFFQRERVWGTSKQQKFIDTIIKGWGVPKIYLHLRKKTSTNEYYACVDGKQRLISVFSFLTNGYGLAKNTTPVTLASKEYGDLPRKTQDLINEYKFTIEIISAATDDELSELFRRLQLGVTLNSAEKLFSISNEMTTFVKSIAKSNFFKESVKVNNKRYAHFAISAQICCTELSGALVNLKYSNLETFVNSYPIFNKNGYEANRIRNILKLMHGIFGVNSNMLSNRASIVSSFLIISDLLKREDMSKNVTELRKFFNTFYLDLKKVKASESKKLSSSDAELLKYQNAVIQSADSLTSIKTRNDILMRRLINHSQYFKKVLGAWTDEDKFKELYFKLKDTHANNPTDFNNWLIANVSNIKTIQCGRGVETLPIHVRHSLHHPKHTKHTKKQLSYSIKILETLL